MSPSAAPRPTPPSPTDVPPTRRSRIGRRTRLALAALAVAVLGGIGIFVATRGSTPEPLDAANVRTIASGVVQKAIEDLQSAPANSAVVYQKILPSLVQIETRDPSAAGSGLGAGVIVNESGAILTALHVVDGAESVRVSFVDGTVSAAAIASTDPANDIAVLMPQQGPEVIVPAVLGGGGQVGDETYAVGHPLGYSGSLTSGVISGLDRSATGDDGVTLRGLIQFDAAVNPGSSGGPLLNRAGEVIGIVTALAKPSAASSRDDYFIGIGFAVPIGTAGGAANAPPK
jgi:S1-C subfamily serine protease